MANYKLASLVVNSTTIATADISALTLTLEHDPTNATLPISVCELNIKNNSSYSFNEHDKITITFSASGQYNYDIVGVFYISKIDRSNDKEIIISAVDVVGLLEEQNFEREYLTGVNPTTIISDILSGYDISYYLDTNQLSRFGTSFKPVFEKQTKRQALQQVMFATGIKLRTFGIGLYSDFQFIGDEFVAGNTNIPDTVVYRGSSLVKNNEVTGVSVISHDYKKDDFGTIIINEDRYSESNKVRSLKRTGNENIINVNDAVCIQQANLVDIALMIYNKFQNFQEFNFDYVWQGNRMCEKVTVEGEDGMHTGFIKKMILDVGLMSVVASVVTAIPNSNIVSPTSADTQIVTNTGAISNVVTYDELIDLIKNKKLVAGAKYTLSDYETIIGDYDDYKVETYHGFNLVIEALSANRLSSNVKAIPKDGDTYYSDCDLSKWEIKYTPFNQKYWYTFAKEIITDNSGYAMRLKYMKESYWEYAIDYQNMTVYSKPFPSVGDKIYTNSSLTTQWGTFATISTGKGVIYYLKDDRENEAGYDFKNIKFPRYNSTGRNAIFTDGLSEPTTNITTANYAVFYSYDRYRGSYHPGSFFTYGSTKRYYYTFDDGSGNDLSVGGNICSCNVIEPYVYYYAGDATYVLGKNIIIGLSSNNIIKNGCTGITLFQCDGVVVGQRSYWGFISNCYDMVLGKDCYEFFAEGANNIKIGDKCNNFLIASGCQNIELKDYAGYIRISNSSSGITIDGNNIQIGAYSYNIEFGPGCSNIIFKQNYCKHMSFGAGANHLYITTNAYAPSYGYELQNLTVVAGTNYSDNGMQTISLPPYDTAKKYSWIYWMNNGTLVHM